MAKRRELCTGVFWGAFDPPTRAHQAIVEAVLAETWLCDLIIVVNNHAYKNYTHSLEERLLMMRDIVISHDVKKIIILSQDDKRPLHHQALAPMTPYPLCAVAGYDAYKKWLNHSSPEDRRLYGAIAVIPRGRDAPLLFDQQAFLLEIDASYRDVSSTQLKAYRSCNMDWSRFKPSLDRNASIK